MVVHRGDELRHLIHSEAQRRQEIEWGSGFVDIPAP
jgi:hypothetical protein